MAAPLTIDAFDATIADIYEAALDPAHWDVAMGGIVNRSAPTGWEVAFLIWETIAPPSGRFVGAFGVNEFARAGYLHAFAGRQPWSIHAHGLPVGRLVHSDELLPREQFKACDLYQRFLASWGLEAALIGIVDRSGPQRLGLVLPGGAEDPGPQLYEAMRRYLPHIQRATRISRKLGEANLRADNAEAVLQRTPNATFVLGADLNIQFANQRAEAFLAQGYCDAHTGRLRLRLRNAQAQSAIQALADGSDTAPSAAFTLENDGLPPFRMLAMRIAAPIAETLCGPVEGGTVLLVGHPHAGGVPVEALDRYASWFNLTPTEARLAAMLAQGASLEDYARNRAVTVNAGRFLLKSIFAKTGASRQAELVALLRDAPDGWIEQGAPTG